MAKSGNNGYGKIVNRVLQPIESLLRRPDAIEIKINDVGGAWVENAAGKWTYHKIKEATLPFWKSVGDALGIATAQDFKPTKPMIRAMLPGGHRMMLVMGPNVRGPNTIGGEGVAASIRLQRRKDVTLASFENDGRQVVLPHREPGRRKVSRLRPSSRKRSGCVKTFWLRVVWVPEKQH